MPDIPRPKKIGVKDLRQNDTNRPSTQPSKDQKIIDISSNVRLNKSTERPYDKLQKNTQISNSPAAILNSEIKNIELNEIFEEQGSRDYNSFEDETDFEVTRENLRKKLADNETEEQGLERLINSGKNDAMRKIGKQNFTEIYGVLKSKIISQVEPTQDELDAMDEFIRSRLSTNSDEIQYSLFKILSLEEKLAKSQEISRKIQYELL